MKIVAVNGSPKGRKSNTNVMLQALLDGLRTDEITPVTIHLSEHNINYCKGCYSCWTKTPGKCSIEDALPELIKQIVNSDLIIWGTPLYFHNISGTLKVFMDRMTSIGGDPHSKDKSAMIPPYFIMMSNCGFPIKEQFEAVSVWIKSISKLLQAKLIGEFYLPSGHILSYPTEEQLQAKNNYLEFLKNCGKDYRTNNFKLTEKNLNQINKTILEF